MTQDKEQTGTPYTSRQTYYMKPEIVERIKAAAWWERATRADIVNAAVEAYIDRLEKKRGEPYKPVAKVRRGRPIKF